MKKVSLKKLEIMQCLVPGICFLLFGILTSLRLSMGVKVMNNFIYFGLAICFLINAFCKMIVAVKNKAEEDDELSKYIKYEAAYITWTTFIEILMIAFIIVALLYIRNNSWINPIVLLEILIGMGYLIHYFVYTHLLNGDDDYVED